MLIEFALLREVLAAPTPSQGELHEACLAQLADLLLTDGLVRDLRDGGWSQQVLNDLGNLSIAGKQLFEALAGPGACRLRPAPATSLPPPADAYEWLYEALGSQEQSAQNRKMTAVLAPHALAEEQADPFIVSVQRLHGALWWQARSCSIRLERTTSDYLRHLAPVLLHSNSLMFIDPNLDPRKANYAQFEKLLLATPQGGNKPRIEIHRSQKASGPDGRPEYPNRNEWMGRFAPLGEALRPRGLKAEVFIWPDFHDRYLISNLIGLSVPNGFDVATDLRKHPLRTTWTRLGRRDADEVQREYDGKVNEGRLGCEPFMIGA